MNRLKIILAALLLPFAAAHAAPPPCTGANLLEKLKADDPPGYAQVMRDAAAVKNGGALLWKIERQGLEPSWLMGTAHITDPRITVLSAAARQALSRSATVALELKEIRSKQEMAAAALRNARFMVLPAGENLWDLIPDAEEAAIRDNPNLPPGAVNTIFGYQPWVIAAMLSIPACEYRRTAAGVISLDESLARQAEAQGSELVGLETVAEQFGTFAAMPQDLQVRYLISVAHQGPRIADYFETLIDLYEARKVTAYLPLALKLEPETAGDDAMMAFVERDLTIRRNQVMARRAADLLARGDVFIAVGALHLSGDQGLVELIRKAGYKVTPVN